jgi:hypothetical protein
MLVKDDEDRIHEILEHRIDRRHRRLIGRRCRSAMACGLALFGWLHRRIMDLRYCGCAAVWASKEEIIARFSS